MRVRCTQEFKDEVDKLKRNKSYASLEAELLGQYCNTTFEKACEGDLLSVFPWGKYVKKRLGGSGGYRVYIVAVVVGEDIFIGHVHPKTGKHGLENLTVEETKAVLRQILSAKKSGDLYDVLPDKQNAKRLIIARPEPISI